MIKKPQLIIIGLTMLMVLVACNKKNQYDVNFFMPEAKTNGVLWKFVSSYGLKKYGVPLNSDSVIVWTDKFQKQYFGGVGITGTITINNDSIIFEPRFDTFLTNEGISTFKIPISDVIKVRSESFLIITKAVVVNTKNGEFKFQLPKAKHFYNPLKFEDEEICNLIRERMN